jgi:uncharacterized protein YjbI with pentapeptide repeats
VYSTAAIAFVGAALLVGTIIPGLRLYWPHHRDPVSRTDLGVALMTGALVAFAILVLQLMIQVRTQHDEHTRAAQADRQGLLLLLGRSGDLSGLSLPGRDLTDAFLNYKTLRGANFADAQMHGALLQEATLTAANLAGAKLRGATLARADARYANFSGADLDGAELTGANLDDASFADGVDSFGRTHTNLRDADLSNAQARADFENANLTDARLVATRLGPANLRGADLTGADLHLADLRGADLRGANLLHARNLDKVKDISFAVYDSQTQFPLDFEWASVRPRCDKARCTLPVDRAVQQGYYPAEIAPLRAALTNATKDLTCLPGWWVEDQQSRVVAYSPHKRASFKIVTAPLGAMTPEDWAGTFSRARHVEIPGVGVAGGTAYAERFVAEETIETNGGEAKRTQPVVGVFFRDSQGRGFGAFATAAAPVFPLFKRDFVKLFRALGIQGDLFPQLQGDKIGCDTRR